jgi:Fic/DOC family
MNVDAFIDQEVHNQGFLRGTPEHLGRCAAMQAAWVYGARVLPDLDTVDELYGVIVALYHLVEPSQNDGKRYRTVNVRVSDRRCPEWTDVPTLMRFFCSVVKLLPPLEAYRLFELVHAGRDGNGRVGKVLYNWLLDKLDDPEFPPNLFGGDGPV